MLRNRRIRLACMLVFCKHALPAAYLAITGRINGLYAQCFLKIEKLFVRSLSGVEMEYEVSKDKRFVFYSCLCFDTASFLSHSTWQAMVILWYELVPRSLSVTGKPLNLRSNLSGFQNLKGLVSKKLQSFFISLFFYLDAKEPKDQVDSKVIFFVALRNRRIRSAFMLWFWRIALPAAHLTITGRINEVYALCLSKLRKFCFARCFFDWPQKIFSREVSSWVLHVCWAESK